MKNFELPWSDIFLLYERLRVPWNIILGNHDYMGRPEAQINFTTSNQNIGGFWNMPHNYYKFSESIDDKVFVDFFALDTNACQGHVQRSHPETISNLQLQKNWLIDELQHSDARWKIVFGHHPMYTKGRGHGCCGRCFRDELYALTTPIDSTTKKKKGFGFERALEENDVSLYISGHEHVFQHHKGEGHNVQHVVCGNSGAEMRVDANGFYLGPDRHISIDWVANALDYGFMVYRVTLEKIVIEYVNHHAEVFEAVEIVKPLMTSCDARAYRRDDGKEMEGKSSQEQKLCGEEMITDMDVV